MEKEVKETQESMKKMASLQPRIDEIRARSEQGGEGREGKSEPKSESVQALTITQPLTVSADGDVHLILSDWVRALKRRARSGELAATTTKTYWRGMARFIAWCDEQEIESVSDDVLRDWLGEMNESYTPAAISTWLAGVRAFFVWAVGAGRLSHNPAAGVRSAARRGTSKRHKRQALTDDEVMRVLAAPDTNTTAGVRDRAILALMAYNGARSVEVQRFNINNVRTENGQMVIDVHGKGRAESDEVLVVCNQDAIKAMHDWIAERVAISTTHPTPPGDALFISLSNRSFGGRLSLRAIRHTVKGYYQASGVVGEGKTTHSLRHSFASNAARNGAPVQKLQSAMRHASIKDTMIYFHEMDRLTNPAEAFVTYGG
jgi:site-specific recombinase XerD